MIRVFITYSVPPEKVAENEAAIKKFIDAVKAANDPGFSYSCYKMPDGNSFTHVGWFADQAAKQRFQEPAWFGEFAKGLQSRVSQPPQVTPVTLIASSEVP